MTLCVDNQVIPQGNFYFLSFTLGKEDLFKKFYDAEKNLKIDYIDFAHKIRKAYEAFALEEEAMRRKNQNEFANKELDEIKKIVTNEIKEPSSIINYKNIIIDLCDGKEQKFVDMLVKYSFVRHPENESEVRMRLKKYIRFIYSFGSESSHENVVISEECIPNKENCLKVAGSFHDFLCAYYELNHKFDSSASYKVYTILGDGEIEEGQVWEAAMFANQYHLDNLVAIVDNNGLQIDGKISEVCSPEPIPEKFEAFGWHVIRMDAHDFDSIDAAMQEAESTVGKPVVIIQKSVKGKGVSFMENQVGWHGKAPNQAEYEQAMAELTAQLKELEG